MNFNFYFMTIPIRSKVTINKLVHLFLFAEFMSLIHRGILIDTNHYKKYMEFTLTCLQICII